MACPRTNGNPPECPLYAIRSMEVASRMRYLESASLEEVRAIADMCRECTVQG